jgi:RimJ/RimL family protein N-acetyltransferase
MSRLQPERIATARLTLEPLSREAAAQLLAGDLSAVVAGGGWPHEDTADGLRMMASGSGQVWLVMAGDVVIGDCGLHAAPDDAGVVEIGFGLADAYRGKGYGRELVRGLCGWLLAQPGVEAVVARGVLEGNSASRRTLEGCGFGLEQVHAGVVDYALMHPAVR